MSDANLFRRIVSTRLLFRSSLIFSTAAAALSAVCLVALLLCLGATAGLIEGKAAGAAGGLLPILQQDQFPDRVVRQLVLRIPALQTNYTATMTLAAAALILLSLRWGLQTLTNRLAAAHAAKKVRRIRQHLHRQSLRLNSGDLTGERVDVTRHLFRESASTVELSAQRWASTTLLCSADMVALVTCCCVTHLFAGMQCLIPVFAAWFVLVLENKRLSAASDLLAEQVDRSLDQLAAGLEKSRIVAGYGMETFERDRFEENLTRFGQRRRQVRQQNRRGSWMTRFILAFAVGAPMFILMRQILAGSELGLPGAAIIGASAALLFRRLRDLEQTQTWELEGTVAAEEIDEYIRSVPGVSQVVRARFLEPMTRSLQFDQVCFDGPERPGLLNQLDLKIEAGQRVALISLDREETAALVSLVPRLNDPQSGQVLIDGKDISRATLESLRAEAMVVSGSRNLFNASVLENITCGQADISRQQAMEAGKICHTEKFTRQLPRGYETQIGDFGIQLDPGQAFRLALSRAIVRKPALMFVEEPVDPLDSETKTLLDDTYDRICPGRTVIFLPARLSTVKKCDRVILLDEGRIVADGSHDELVRSSELYRHWEYIRFNVFRAGDE